MARIHLPSTSYVVTVEGQFRVACKYRGARVLLQTPFETYESAKSTVVRVNTLRHIDPSLWKRG